eukprot:CAMPEP_0183390048 /NCGR_PEP_ID=MMETSP0370-20130417/5366_1 /TAXON_ID=268820 /ORGANISM="Peridinium aciculiferum, Strain PAER-2" /LENGTH=173 /DNA_ID=CAMNT_0025569435 /DNA_START=47 /DNA_END=564 /DNA_ORIENTATION=-
MAAALGAAEQSGAGFASPMQWRRASGKTSVGGWRAQAAEDASDDGGWSSDGDGPHAPCGSRIGGGRPSAARVPLSMRRPSLAAPEPGRAWEFPLTHTEKRRRLILVFELEQSLAECSQLLWRDRACAQRRRCRELIREQKAMVAEVERLRAERELDRLRCDSEELRAELRRLG